MRSVEGIAEIDDISLRDGPGNAQAFSGGILMCWPGTPPPGPLALFAARPQHVGAAKGDNDRAIADYNEATRIKSRFFSLSQ